MLRRGHNKRSRERRELNYLLRALNADPMN
jgi:hypothetical protein